MSKFKSEMHFHILPLSAQLDIALMEYMADNFKDGAQLDFALNLFINAYMSSLAHVMRLVVKDHAGVRQAVEEKLKEIATALKFERIPVPQAN